MKAAILNEPKQPLEVAQVDVDPPKAGEVAVKVAAAGVCHSDYHVMNGDLPATLPAILGHEGAGIVEAVGEGVTAVQPGNHVILLFRASCGRCEYCSTGHPALCGVGQKVRWTGQMPDGTSRFRRAEGGAEVKHFAGVSCFGEQTVVLEEAVVPIRQDAPLEIAALVGCGVMTGVGAVVNTARVEPGSSVLVIGAGGVGLSTVMGAQLTGAEKIIVADLVANKLEMSLEFGATDTIDASREDTLARVKALTNERGVDYAFEAIGNTRTLAQCFQAVRRGGTAVAVGVAPAGAEVSVSAFDLVLQEKALIGSFYGSTRPHHDMPRLLDLYMAGKLPLDKLITRRYPIDEINEAYRAMMAGEVARSVITYS
jgi:S-(hydroxymethyl)glutathione dehydrogenase / alcohol dehydrogenase